MRTLAVLTAEGFTATITEDASGRVSFTADGDIDADGANGQNGALAAYRVDNRGSEDLANGGMGIRGGKAIFVASWGPDIALVGPDGQPLVLPNGVIPTKTAYRFPGKSANDFAAYVDAETVPYIVVPPLIVKGVSGIVKGCQAFATYKGKRVAAVVADIGPRTKCGELSIALARELGINPSPRVGGIEGARILYELFPGKPAKCDNFSGPLIPS